MFSFRFRSTELLLSLPLRMKGIHTSKMCVLHEICAFYFFLIFCDYPYCLILQITNRCIRQLGKTLQEVISEWVTKLNNREFGNATSLFILISLRNQRLSALHCQLSPFYCFGNHIGLDSCCLCLLNIVYLCIQ